MGQPAGATSLLLAPLGSGSLLCQFHWRIPQFASGGFSVFPTFAPTPGYAEAVRHACSEVRDIRPADSFVDGFTKYDVSDWILIGDPRCFPLEPLDTDALFDRVQGDRRSVVHLVAMRQNPGGTTERVEFDTRGQVKGIQRYYDTRTWNFASDVVCSLIPISALLSVGRRVLPLRSLAELRCDFVAHGVPSRDVAVACTTLDLRREGALLRLNEQIMLETAEHGRAPHQAAPAVVSVHPSARLHGPVSLHDGVVLEEGARIVGPTVVGAGARIGAGALVAECIVGPGARITPGASMRQRAAFEDVADTLLPEATRSGDAYIVPLHVDAASEPRRSLYPAVKSVIDCVSALLGLLVLSPLLAIVAILVRLESAGSVLYADIRETRGGMLFRCWKFRTMYTGASDAQRALLASNEMDGPQFKIEGDPRITRMGRWLRKISFDELPQLYNVLVGEMSLVGPRPSPFRENQICIPWRNARLSVRAGITGLWQVCRQERTTGDFHQWIYYDLLYARHVSFLVDLKILIATVLTCGGMGRVPVRWIIPNAVDIHEPAVSQEAHAAVYDRV